MNINVIKFIFEKMPENNKLEINYDSNKNLKVDLKFISYSFYYGSVIFRNYSDNGVIVIDSEAINMIKSYKSNINGALMEEQIEMEV